MFFQIPVVAFDSCAISDTMGGAGVLVHKKDTPIIAGLLDMILSNPDLYNRIVIEQKKNVNKYTTPVMQFRLQELLCKWSVSNV